jgi:hypothetical protein
VVLRRRSSVHPEEEAEVGGGEQKKAAAVVLEMVGPDFICAFEHKTCLSTGYAAYRYPSRVMRSVNIRLLDERQFLPEGDGAVGIPDENSLILFQILKK